MTNARSLAKALATLLALPLAAVTAASAQTPESLGQFNQWAAYAYSADGGRVCYVISQPQRTEPSGVNRGSIYLFVSHRPGEGVRNEVSVITGYPYREGSQTTVEIGSDTFVMFTKDDGAWVENASEESRLVTAMKGGSNMVVRGTSSRGTQTTDTYSLMGITAAINAIDGECSG